MLLKVKEYVWSRAIIYLLFVFIVFNTNKLCFYLRFVYPLSYYFFLSSQSGAESTVFHSGVKDLDSNALISYAWIITVGYFIFPVRKSSPPGCIFHP